MKRTLAAVVLSLTLSGVALAGPGRGPMRGSGGWGMAGPYHQLYDPKKAETLSGEVTRVSEASPMRGMGPGVLVELKTDKETVTVHLGPAWYLDNQDLAVQKGDHLEVTGARADVQGKPALLAAEVKKGDQVLKLRDEAGVPVWAGWRRR